MRYNLNTAYDYNRIKDNAAPKRVSQNKAEIKPLPQKHPRKSGGARLAVKVLVAFVVLFMVCFNIYTRSEISDTQKDIDSANSQIEELNSQHTMLEMKMQNLVSYSNLEQEAAKLGMHKKTKSQIHYIDTSGDDRAEIVNGGK